MDYDDDTTFYVWYGNATATAYSHTDTYGTHAVWADYEIVCHMESDTVTDSSPNSYDFTKVGSPTATAGQVGNCVTFSGTGQYYYRLLADTQNVNTSDSFTINIWTNTDKTSGWSYTYKHGYDASAGALGPVLNHGGKMYGDESGLSANTASTTTPTTNTWYYWTQAYSSALGKAALRLNATQESYIDVTGTREVLGTAGHGGGSTPVCIAAQWVSNNFDTGSMWDGELDEIRMANVYRTPDWTATEYNNQSSPATFITEGTEVDVGSTSVTITPDALALTSVINDGTISAVRNITTILSVQSLTSSVPTPTINTTINTTVTLNELTLTSSQPNCTVYPLAETTTASSVIYMANRDRIAIKLNDSGTVYLELD